MRRKDIIFIKIIYAPTLRDDWARWEGAHYTDKLDDLLNDPQICRCCNNACSRAL